MKMRWLMAAVAALALAVLTLNAPLSWPALFSDDAKAAGPACDPKVAKAAKLNFTLKDANNKDVRLSDLKGKVILLDFWATWCGPCKIEIPWFIEFQNKYGKDGLAVVGVSVDDTPEKLRPFVAEFKMNYPVLQGLNHDDFVEDAYGPMFGIPTTFVIGRDGKICTKHVGMSSKDAFEREIKSLL
jgi:thiol-disulfide isomerase/thioredoxin